MKSLAVLVLPLLCTGALPAQSQPLVMKRGNHTLILERIQLAVSNTRLVSDGTPARQGAGAETVQLDLRRNTVAFTVPAPEGKFEDVLVDLQPRHGWSVRIVGTMDTTAFDMKLPIERTVCLPLLIPQRVNEATEMMVRIRLNAATWFRNSSSGALLDPIESQELVAERIDQTLAPTDSC